jgi:hypothetical protein
VGEDCFFSKPPGSFAAVFESWLAVAQPETTQVMDTIKKHNKHVRVIFIMSHTAWQSSRRMLTRQIKCDNQISYPVAAGGKRHGSAFGKINSNLAQPKNSADSLL